MKTRVVPVVVLFVLSGVTGADDGRGPGEQPARFKVTAQRPDDAVRILGDKGHAVFDVKSPFGISRATIERLGDTWPGSVVMRLHLKGLENFRASNGRVTLQARAGIRDGRPDVGVWVDGHENTPLGKQSPLWVGIRILRDDGRSAKELPLRDGYFDVELPRAFFRDNPQSITVCWIDFYR